MLGIIITGFIDMVEEASGAAVVDTLMNNANSAYTAYEQYDDEEFYRMVAQYADIENISGQQAYEKTGQFLFAYLMALHPQLNTKDYAFKDILRYLDSDIHPAVASMYSDSRLPKVKVVAETDNTMTIEHHTHRQTHGLLVGLIKGMAIYFSTPVEISVIQPSNPFTIDIQWRSHA